MNKVDITGTMATSQLGWQSRTEELCKPEHFSVQIWTSREIDDKLTDREVLRLSRHLQLVQEWTRYMAAGMLKGVLKYDTDDYTIEQWMAHMIGESVDSTNYKMLLFNAWRKDAMPK